MGLTPGGRSGTFIPGWLPPVPPELHSPRKAPLPGPRLPSRPSLPPTFYPQPVCYFLNVVSLRAALTRARKRIINKYYSAKNTPFHLRQIFNCQAFQHCFVFPVPKPQSVFHTFIFNLLGHSNSRYSSHNTVLSGHHTQIHFGS